MNYLAKMTVPVLREIATRMDLESALTTLDLPKINRAKKADLIKVITYGIEEDWDDAITENRQRVTKAIADGFKASQMPVERIYRGIGTSRRVQNYRRQNGSLKLTQPQIRRANKKIRKELSYVN